MKLILIISLLAISQAKLTRDEMKKEFLPPGTDSLCIPGCPKASECRNVSFVKIIKDYKCLPRVALAEGECQGRKSPMRCPEGFACRHVNSLSIGAKFCLAGTAEQMSTYKTYVAEWEARRKASGKPYENPSLNK
jgi:hypothetical protein